MRQPHQTCETCQHCAVLTVVDKLECRIKSPVVLVWGDYPHTVWPEVTEDRWCGEWGQKA